MALRNLFLSSQGRVGRGGFWLGSLAMIAAGLAASRVPGLGWIVACVLVYPCTSVYAKRLHDFGRSGWLVMAPVLATLLALSISAAALNADLFRTAGAPSPWRTVGLTALAAALACDLLFVLWVGLRPGHAEENVYGAPDAGPRAIGVEA